MKKRFLPFLTATLLFLPALSADHHKKSESQEGSTVLGCLEDADGEGYVISDGTVDGAVVLGNHGGLKSNIGHWVKLDGESFTAGGVEHFRARTVTSIAETCDTGRTESMSRSASAELKNTKGKVVGKAQLRQVPHGVWIQIAFDGIASGRHALHIHEKGDCSASDFTSAGGHFNPSGASHGYLDGSGHHAGDMPNFEVPKSGKITVELINSRVTLAGSRSNSLLGSQGTAIVVHDGTDDYKTQSAGDAGSRIACGVIQSSK